MRYASLCSGVGGIDLACDQAGMECVYQCENGETVRISDSARYRLVGNGVAVPVVNWIAKRLMEEVLR